MFVCSQKREEQGGEGEGGLGRGGLAPARSDPFVDGMPLAVAQPRVDVTHDVPLDGRIVIDIPATGQGSVSSRLVAGFVAGIVGR